MSSRRVIAGMSAAALVATQISGVFAAPSNIGTGSVTNSGALTTPIVWDGNFPGTATGVINGIAVTARILPTLNMNISTGSLDLGVLVPGVQSTQSLTIEVGTNAAKGVLLTARSSSGGLTDTDPVAPLTQINNLTADGLAESYKFRSTPGTSDSSYVGYTKTATLNSEVNTTTTEHVVLQTNKPERTNAQDDVNFFVDATAGAETPAGNYADKIVFTITGNF